METMLCPEMQMDMNESSITSFHRNYTDQHLADRCNTNKREKSNEKL